MVVSHYCSVLLSLQRSPNSFSPAGGHNKPRYFCIRPLDPLNIIGSETGKTHVVTSHAVQSTAAIRDRTVSE